MHKIVIIEDDRAINQMYRMKFEAQDFDVRIAYDGQSGIELIKAFAPEIVLLDLQMPEMTGDEVLKSIRQDAELAKTKVIILTNTSAEEAPASLDELKPDDYIVKAELTPSQVVERTRELLNNWFI